MIKTHDIIKQTTSDTKITILCHMLKQPESTVSELAQKMNSNRTNVSKQINEMKKANLLNMREDGRNNYYSLTKDLHPEQLRMIKSIVNSFHYIDEGKTKHKFYD